jgi:subtilisin family serine protease/fibronectin type 3 domain-containing protein
MIVERLETRALLTIVQEPALLIGLEPGLSITSIWESTRADGLTVEPTLLPDVYRVTGAGLDPFQSSLRTIPGVRYAEAEQSFSVALAPNDPKYTDGTLWGLNGDYGIRAPEAWNETTGSTRVVVADIDTGIDYRHDDLYLNIWINQGEIPSAVRSNLTDVDSDGLITFYDLNARDGNGNFINVGTNKITDITPFGRIDGRELLASLGSGGWADGISQDGNSYVDDLIGWDFVNNDNNPLDDHGHGTHTTGTIAGIGNNGVGVAGVAWTAQVMPLKVLDAGGGGYDSAIAAATRYAADMGARVSNNSYGGGGYSQTMYDAIAYARTKNHVFVAAAGNNGWNTDLSANYPSGYNLDNIISVAATTSTGGLASFSNYGRTSVDLGAPGVGIYSTLPNNSYASWNGTSMATPHVVGVAALVLSVNSNLTHQQVIGEILNNTTPLASLANKTVTGGLVNARLAVADPPAAGPRVVDASPSGYSVVSPINTFRITFSAAIQDGSFTTGDVASLTGPGGTIAPINVVKVSDTVYDVTFADQTALGTYTLTIGPNILDTSGNPMNQDGDSTNGETPDDQFTVSVTLIDRYTQFDFGTAQSPVEPGYAQVTPSTTYSSSLGYGWQNGSILEERRDDEGVTASPLLIDLNYTQDGTFAVDLANGSYTVTLHSGDTGPYHHDYTGVYLEGQQVDTIVYSAQNEVVTRSYNVVVQDGQLNLRLQEQGGSDYYVTILGLEIARYVDTTPPSVIASSPTGVVYGGFNQLTVTFSEPIDSGTFTTSDVGIVGPSGSITATSVTALSATEFRVSFPAQSTVGSYAFTIGPDISDFASNEMASAYTTTVTVQALPDKFDFGTADSPVATDYARVTHETAYSASTGFGWLLPGPAIVESVDRGTSNLLDRDLNFSYNATFVVDVPNGTYSVTMKIGDRGPYHHDYMGFYLEGHRVARLSTKPGQILTRNYTTTVSDGQLTLQIRDLGGSDYNVVINSLEFARQASGLASASLSASTRAVPAGLGGNSSGGPLDLLVVETPPEVITSPASKPRRLPAMILPPSWM